MYKKSDDKFLNSNIKLSIFNKLSFNLFTRPSLYQPDTEHNLKPELENSNSQNYNSPSNFPKYIPEFNQTSNYSEQMQHLKKLGLHSKDHVKKKKKVTKSEAEAYRKNKAKELKQSFYNSPEEMKARDLFSVIQATANTTTVIGTNMDPLTNLTKKNSKQKLEKDQDPKYHKNLQTKRVNSYVKDWQTVHQNRDLFPQNITSEIQHRSSAFTREQRKSLGTCPVTGKDYNEVYESPHETDVYRENMALKARIIKKNLSKNKSNSAAKRTIRQRNVTAISRDNPSPTTPKNKPNSNDPYYKVEISSKSPLNVVHRDTQTSIKQKSPKLPREAKDYEPTTDTTLTNFNAKLQKKFQLEKDILLAEIELQKLFASNHKVPKLDLNCPYRRFVVSSNTNSENSNNSLDNPSTSSKSNGSSRSPSPKITPQNKPKPSPPAIRQRSSSLHRISNTPIPPIRHSSTSISSPVRIQNTSHNTTQVSSNTSNFNQTSSKSRTNNSNLTELSSKLEQNTTNETNFPLIQPPSNLTKPDPFNSQDLRIIPNFEHESSKYDYYSGMKRSYSEINWRKKLQEQQESRDRINDLEVEQINSKAVNFPDSNQIQVVAGNKTSSSPQILLTPPKIIKKPPNIETYGTKSNSQILHTTTAQIKIDDFLIDPNLKFQTDNSKSMIDLPITSNKPPKTPTSILVSRSSNATPTKNLQQKSTIVRPRMFRSRSASRILSDGKKQIKIKRVKYRIFKFSRF